MITSVVEIKSFRIEDVGRYSCQAVNQNYGGEDAAFIHLNYTLGVVITPPEVMYYTETGVNQRFDWSVTGWPLEDISMTCNATNSSYSTELNDGMLSFTLNEPVSRNITCTIYNDDIIIDSTMLTKASYNCTIAYSECIPCIVNSTLVVSDCRADESGIASRNNLIYRISAGVGGLLLVAGLGVLFAHKRLF